MNPAYEGKECLNPTRHGLHDSAIVDSSGVFAFSDKHDPLYIQQTGRMRHAGLERATVDVVSLHSLASIMVYGAV